ncbi:hypothetical protein GCM10007385_46440 [Tateyamaria omphalii]|uniref:hypothetical protein n=1 Tax=Tateyamaria omphalii TaxID=299262 RepID=UPI001673A462|nr:hypothetical protein [Tateyamaria omphalii]GGX72387.1 hypothetical protein GCM10007385_46440 [Tateyamaria omphalii]
MRKRKELGPGAERQMTTAFEALDNTEKRVVEPAEPVTQTTPTPTKASKAAPKAKNGPAKVPMRLTLKINAANIALLEQKVRDANDLLGIETTPVDVLRNLIESNQDVIFDQLKPKKDT